ncbi:MAG: TolC family protein [Acidobacteria bacterium]|nr:TolC family protein [Acidobacteriota bacterium]
MKQVILKTAALALAVLFPLQAAAQSSPDVRVRELLGEVAARSQAAVATGPVVTLALDEAVRRALDRNLDIAVERLNPQTHDLSIAQLNAAYRPTLTSTLGQRAQVNPPTSQLNGGQRVENDVTTYNGGLTQTMPWAGGSFSVTWNNTRSNTSNIFANYNPSYVSNFTAVFTQPLLRGLSIDANRQQLQITRINRDISEIQLRATITNTLANVRNAYWDLLYTLQALDVAGRSLDLATKLIEDNKARVEVGTMAPIDVVQAEAEAAVRRQTLTVAEASAKTAELALKRLIVGGTDDPLWRATLTPTDRPSFAREPIDVEKAVRHALDKRTDLAQAKEQLASSNVTLRYLHNQKLPALDLVGTYGLQGLGGRQFIRSGSGLGSVVTGSVPGGFADALDNIAGRDYPTWNVSVNVSYPIGMSSADAQYARARVQFNQAQAQIRALELQVATDVSNAALQVESSLKRVESASAARQLAERRLEAEQSKFEVGMSTNFFVVQAQRDLADAQNAELRALLDYRKALVDFERVQETSLSRAGITIVSPTSGTGTTGSGTTGGGRSGSPIGGTGTGSGSGTP